MKKSILRYAVLACFFGVPSGIIFFFERKETTIEGITLYLITLLLCIVLFYTYKYTIELCAKITRKIFIGIIIFVTIFIIYLEIYIYYYILGKDFDMSIWTVGLIITYAMYTSLKQTKREC